MLSVFYFCVFCVWSGVFCRFLSFFSSKGRFLEKISGANFCFWVVVLVLCFLVGFCLCFCFIFGGSLPKVFGKNSLDVRSAVFWALSLLLFFFVDVVFGVFFLRDRDQVVTGHPLTRTGVAGSFSRLCPFAFLFRPFWPCVLLLGGFSGCRSGPRAIFGILLGPSEAFFLGREAAGVFLCFSCLFSFPLLFCGHTFSRMTGGGLTNLAGAFTTPQRSDSQGIWPSLARGLCMEAPFLGFCWEGHRDPRTHSVQGLCLGRGLFLCPLTGPFSHALCFVPSPGFFFWPLGPRLPWIA